MLLIFFLLYLNFLFEYITQKFINFSRRILNSMITYHSKHHQHQRSSINQNNNMEVPKAKHQQVNNLRFIQQKSQKNIFQPSLNSIHERQKNNISRREITLRTNASQMFKITELEQQEKETNRIKMVCANKQSYSALIQSQPVKIRSNENIEKDAINIVCSGDREDRNNIRFSSNNPLPQLSSRRNRQINRKNTGQKNPLKKLLSYCFGMRENHEEEIQVNNNIYQIRASNGRVINFNVQNSDLLGSFLGVVAVMNQIDAPNKKFLPGLNEEEIKKFVVLFKVDGDFLKKEQNCPICCSQYKEQQQALKLPCKHIYHQKCIKKWLHKKAVCPICKNDFKNFKK